jgi:ectoine hydroxylase-related dioxygenase (phytanoyl-CoA dioxygenase family)
MREQYRVRGFTALEKLFSADETDQLAAVLETGLHRREAEEPRPLDQRTALNRQLTHCYNLWEEELLVREFAFNRRLCSVAAELLDAPAIRLLLDQTFFKEPGGEPTSRHQDITRWPVQGHFITAWIALDNIPQDAGALGYIPGSHAVGPSSMLDLVMKREWTSSQRTLIDRDPEFVPVERGSVIFHDSCVFHLSAGNNTQRRRRAFAIVYGADGAIRSSALPFTPLDWDGVRVGEKLSSPRTPIAWPLDGERLPDPPAPPPELVVGWPMGRPAGAEQRTEQRRRK